MKLGRDDAAGADGLIEVIDGRDAECDYGTGPDVCRRPYGHKGAHKLEPLNPKPSASEGSARTDQSVSDD